MKALLTILLVCCYPSTLLLADEVVVLKNTEGKPIKVIIVSATDDKVKIRFPKKISPMEISMDVLDEASQTLIKDWVKEGNNLSKDISLTTDVSRSNSKTTKEDIGNNNSNNSRNNSDKGTKETKTYSVIPEITILNKSNQLKSAPLTAVVFVYPDPSSGSSKQEIIIPSIEPLRKAELTGETLTYTLTRTKGGNTKDDETGEDFKGYAVFVVDKDGKIIAEKASRKSDLETYREKLE